MVSVLPEDAPEPEELPPTSVVRSRSRSSEANDELADSQQQQQQQ
jgi:hypothetical protein